MFRPGDVVVVDFPGVVETKRRPAVVISSDEYHKYRPDVIVGMFTTQRAKATAPTDYLLQDWATCGLHYPCAFRSFLLTLPAMSADYIGHCSERDWLEIRARLLRALAV
jgi:mRNA interferase MazF